MTTISDRKRITAEQGCVMIALAAIAVRVIYVIATPAFVRQHDSYLPGMRIGHLGYIEYILRHDFRIPALDMDPTRVWQYVHPPLHHLLAALWIKLLRTLGMPALLCSKSVQILTLAYSCLTLCFAYGILKELRLQKSRLVISFSLICFSPVLIQFSGSINNDCLVTMLMAATVWTAMRWYRRPSAKSMAVCGLCFGLAMAAKLSAALMVPALALLFLSVPFQKRLTIRETVFQYAAFLLIAAPLALAYPLYNAIRWDVSPAYVNQASILSLFSVREYSAAQRFFSVQKEQLLHPYLILLGRNKDYNIPLSLIKTATFGEYTLTFKHDTSYTVSCLLHVVHIALWVIGVLSAPHQLRRKWAYREKRTMTSFFLVLLMTMLFSYIRFCFAYPYVCSMDARYIALLLIPGAACIGQTERGKGIASLLTAAFCLLSALQIVLLL